MLQYKRTHQKNIIQFKALGICVNYYESTGTVYVSNGELPKRPKRWRAVTEYEVERAVHKYCEAHTEDELKQAPTTGLVCDASVTEKHGVLARVCRCSDGKILCEDSLGAKGQTHSVMAELAGILMAAAYLADHKDEDYAKVIYCDCAPAIHWATDSKPWSSKDSSSAKAAAEEKLIARCRRILKEHNIVVMKWDKTRFGEPPADFGFK